MHWIGYITTFLTVINILVCLLLIFVVLLQRPKNEGLGAAFGGDTASNIFGAQTTNVLANLTRWLGGLFLGLCLIIAVLGTIDPTRKSAVADYVNQKAAEKQAEAERLKSEEAAKKASENLKGANAEQPKSFSPAVTLPNGAPAPNVTVPPATPLPPVEKPTEPG